MDSNTQILLENLKDLPIEYSTYHYDRDIWSDGMPREKDVLRINMGSEYKDQYWWQDSSVRDTFNHDGCTYLDVNAVSIPMDITFITKGRYEYHIAFREYFFWRSRWMITSQFEYAKGSAILFKYDRQKKEITDLWQIDDITVSDFTSRPFEEWLADTYQYLYDVMSYDCSEMWYPIDWMYTEMMHVKNTYTFLWGNTYMQKYGKEKDGGYILDEDDDKEFLEWYDRKKVHGWCEPRSVWSVI